VSAASTPEARLAELGLSLPEVAAPVAAYVPAVRTGACVYTSGQLPMVSGSLAATGKVGAGVTAEQGKDLARTCALNALAAVKAEIGDLGRVVRVVKVVGYVASDPSFTGQPGVINGASELLGEVFGDAAGTREPRSASRAAARRPRRGGHRRRGVAGRGGRLTSLPPCAGGAGAGLAASRRPQPGRPGARRRHGGAAA
jgi:enamine deaminase RidA (YjgF/YER057c/UK114 family)